MLAWGEFGFRWRRIRKSKASLGWMRARRAQRNTRVCASAESPQADQDRRRILRTRFDPHEKEKQTKK